MVMVWKKNRNQFYMPITFYVILVNLYHGLTYGLHADWIIALDTRLLDSNNRITFCDSCVSTYGKKGRPGAVVRAVSLSHQVVGSKQPLRRFCGGKACLGLSLPQTPLVWEPPALCLPFFMCQ